MSRADAITDSIYSVVKNVYNEKASVVSLMKVVTISMKEVNTFKDLSGSEKKGIVISIVQRVMNDLIKDDRVSDEVHLFIQTVLPTMIDIVVDAARGELGAALKEKVKSWKCWK